LLRNLVTSLFTAEAGRIVTTLEKAKEARRMAEKMITLGKRESVHARRLARRFLPDREVVKKLFDDIAPHYAERQGGYTRVLRIGPRIGDNAEKALLELVGIAEQAQKAAREKESKKKGEKETKGGDKEAKAAKAEAKPKVKRERARTREKKTSSVHVKKTSTSRKIGD